MAFIVNPLVWLGVFLVWRVVNECGLTLFSQPGYVKVTNGQQVLNNGKDRCRIRYIYKDANGPHIDFEVCPASDYLRYPPGSMMPMRSFRMFGRTSIEFGPRSSVWALVVGVILVIVWDGAIIGFFFQTCIKPLSERRLLGEGNAVVGRITEKTIPKNKSPIYGVAYVFTDSAGRTRNDTMYLRRHEHERAQVNDEVLVFYDPRRPKRSVVYAYSQYALREWRECDKQQALHSPKPGVGFES